MNNRAICLVALLLVTAAPSLVAADEPIEIDPLIMQAEQDRIDAVARAMPSTVCVFVPGGAGGGSGVLISPDGYALTNFHVTSPAGSYMRCGLSDGKIYDAVIVGIDPVGDLAMIRLLGRDDFPVAELADSRKARVGDWSMVIGNPFLLASNLQPTVTWGILSGVGRYQYPSGTLLEYADCLQTQASINPGNSGGPIYDAEGRLLGIVGRASFEKRGRINVGVGYAISINQANNFLGYLKSGRIVDHATLGATVATDPDGGARVTNILESSDAFRRGLRYSDEILEVDGRVIQTANDLQNVLATLPSGWRVKMSFRHDGETIDTLVRLMSVHGPDELLEKMAGALPPPPPRRKSAPPKEKGEKDDEGDHEGHPKLPLNLAKPEPKIPKAVSDLLEQRKGYANYHFNLEQQASFIDSLREQFPGGQESDKKTWVIEGATEGDNPIDVSIRVGPNVRSIAFGDTVFEANDKSEMYDLVLTRSVAGMLPALDAWRRMISSGPKKFGESFYLGSMPLGGQRPLRDCMVGIDGEMEVRWLSHPATRSVEAIEVFADRDEDPAELWVVAEGDSKTDPPTYLDLRYGIESVARVKIKSWTVADDPKAQAEEVTQ